jgi:hypothetical protein
MKFYEQLDVVVLVITTTLFVFLLNYTDIFDPEFRNYDLVSEPACLEFMEGYSDPDNVFPDDTDNKTVLAAWAYSDDASIQEFKDSICRARTVTLFTLDITGLVIFAMFAFLIKGNTSDELETFETSWTTYGCGLLCPSIGVSAVLLTPMIYAFAFPCCYGAMILGTAFCLVAIVLVNCLMPSCNKPLETYLNLDAAAAPEGKSMGDVAGAVLSRGSVVRDSVASGEDL